MSKYGEEAPQKKREEEKGSDSEEHIMKGIDCIICHNREVEGVMEETASTL